MAANKRDSISKEPSPILKRLNIDSQLWINCMASGNEMRGRAIGQRSADEKNPPLCQNSPIDSRNIINPLSQH